MAFDLGFGSLGAKVCLSESSAQTTTDYETACASQKDKGYALQE